VLADGTGYFTLETSRAKAAGATTFQRSTKDWSSQGESSLGFWGNVGAVLQHHH